MENKIDMMCNALTSVGLSDVQIEAAKEHCLLFEGDEFSAEFFAECTNGLEEGEANEQK
ncbi:MAG: hypothetical protein FWC13_05410 [Oscillospiraceae bacterium]|nr:hypothetical protein [Oscillospiraceae bacterium]